jgi:hypothetical protein
MYEGTTGRVRFEPCQHFRFVKLDEPSHAIELNPPLPHPEVDGLALNPKPLGDLTRANQSSSHSLIPVMVHVVIC